MAEAEDVIVDAARHATGFLQDLWRRHRGTSQGAFDWPRTLHHLDLLITAALGAELRLQIAQQPLPTTWVRRLFRPHERPTARQAWPATDGRSLWLPAPFDHGVGAAANPAAGTPPAEPPGNDMTGAPSALRLMAMQQAMRALRGSPALLSAATDPLHASVYEVLEANAADAELIRRFPGLAAALHDFRAAALRYRPPLNRFPPARRGLESWLREILSGNPLPPSPAPVPGPAESLHRAQALARDMRAASRAPAIAGLLFRDAWIGELRRPVEEMHPAVRNDAEGDTPELDTKAPRSARLPRRPQIRLPDERDQRAGIGAWMVQTAQPLEHAEDPFGLQRPVDRDDSLSAEEFADSVSELEQARLIATSSAPKEILIGGEPPAVRARRSGPSARGGHTVIRYPEWDWRRGRYRDPGAAVHLLPAAEGSVEWVRRTRQEHQAMLDAIRRQFESLRPQRLRLRRQVDGEEIDLDACIDGTADALAGASMPPGLYQSTRKARRDLAVLLLIDVSGSTDAWVVGQRRVIDVEREALLLVCLAMNSLAETYAIVAFSGEGAGGVTVHAIKSFDEPYGEHVALRIAGLEPQRYTRAGAALRHATSLLMGAPAAQRLLLILSDGKPNDVDEYDGRYGVEDMRQAIVEARLQGIFSFCLTIDRHAANYLPAVFGEHQYALLHRAERLPSALLGWLRRLVKD